MDIQSSSKPHLSPNHHLLPLHALPSSIDYLGTYRRGHFAAIIRQLRLFYSHLYSYIGGSLMTLPSMLTQHTRARGKRSRDDVEGRSGKDKTSFDIQSRGSPEPTQHQHAEASSNGGSAVQPQLPLLNAPLGKVPIPQLKQSRKHESASTAFKRGRTAHACDKCRKSKSGCTGELPCLKCRNAGFHCVYGDGKRDKDRKYGLHIPRLIAG